MSEFVEITTVPEAEEWLKGFVSHILDEWGYEPIDPDKLVNMTGMAKILINGNKGRPILFSDMIKEVLADEAPTASQVCKHLADYAYATKKFIPMPPDVTTNVDLFRIAMADNGRNNNLYRVPAKVWPNNESITTDANYDTTGMTGRVMDWLTSPLFDGFQYNFTNTKIMIDITPEFVRYHGIDKILRLNQVMHSIPLKRLSCVISVRSKVSEWANAKEVMDTLTKLLMASHNTNQQGGDQVDAIIVHTTKNTATFQRTGFRGGFDMFKNIKLYTKTLRKIRADFGV